MEITFDSMDWGLSPQVLRLEKIIVALPGLIALMMNETLFPSLTPECLTTISLSIFRISEFMEKYSQSNSDAELPSGSYLMVVPAFNL